VLSLSLIRQVEIFINMQKKLYYKGLYGDNSIEFVEGLIHVHPFGVIGKRHDGKVNMHAHNNIFQIFIIETGTTELQYDEYIYEITGHAFMTIPKNVAHGFVHKDEVSGWIINLSDAVLEHLLQREADIIVEIDAIHISTIDPEEEKLVDVYKTMKRCIDEYRNNLPGKQLMLESLVSQLIVQLHRLPLETTKLSSSSDNTSKIYFRRFMQLIRSTHSFKKTIENYADELYISQGHLGRVCQTIAGKSPKDIVTDYFVREAQIALTNVDKSIAQVAYGLSFDDPAYFTRLFKKKTGHSPKTFREKHGVKNA
jgi:AraC family transcriptional regulator, transcriptional activator of pobA